MVFIAAMGLAVWAGWDMGLTLSLTVPITGVAQLGYEFGHMHSGSAVDLRRVLAGQHRHSHTADRSARRMSCDKETRIALAVGRRDD